MRQNYFLKIGCVIFVKFSGIVVIKEKMLYNGCIYYLTEDGI